MTAIRIADLDRDKLREWWLDPDKSAIDISQEFGVAYSSIQCRRRKLGLPQRPARKTSDRVADPTQEEIAEQCRDFRERALAELRAETERQTQKRVSAERLEECTIRSYTFAGDCYRAAGALA